MSEAEDSSRRADTRSAARIGAVQALYQMDMAATDANQVIDEFLEDRLGVIAGEIGASGADEDYFRDIVLGVVRDQQQIDENVDEALAEGWSLPRIDSILRAILRSGSYELLNRKDVPAKVVINEYVDIAHAFFEAEEPKVANGVLDHLARQWRAGELQKGA